MNDATPRATRASRRRLRLSGSADAPRARGLVHLGALVLALPAGVALVWRDGTAGGVAVYAAALVGLYATSASYHLRSWSPAALRRMRRLDHAMIYVFIAASMTPYCLAAVPGDLSLVVLGLGWLGAAAVVASVAVSLEARPRLTSAAYLVLGWLAVVTVPEALHRLSTGQLTLLGSMAFLYTAGAGVLATRWPDPRPEVFGYHEVWHAMVVAASACYFVLVWTVVGPHR